MALEAIGTIACPVCGWQHSQVKSTKSELAMIYCDSCGTQVFCRTPKGDRLIRGRMVGIAPVSDPPPSPPKPTDPTPARPPKPRGSFLDEL